MVQPDKIELLKRSVIFLGHKLSKEGIQVDENKVMAIAKMPPPKDVTGVHRFIGAASYYRKFIPEFSIVAQPLFELIKKDKPFRWSEETNESFERLKTLLCSAPVLKSPDFSKPDNYLRNF